jgi:hypothetical protein
MARAGIDRPGEMPPAFERQVAAANVVVADRLAGVDAEAKGRQVEGDEGDQDQSEGDEQFHRQGLLSRALLMSRWSHHDSRPVLC